MFKMKNHNTSTNRIEVKESKSEMLKLCRYGYGNFKKQMTIIPSNNMILNTTVQIFRLLLTRKYVCRLVPINCDFSGPAERVRLMTCRLIGNYHDREFTLYWECELCMNFVLGTTVGVTLSVDLLWSCDLVLCPNCYYVSHPLLH